MQSDDERKLNEYIRQLKTPKVMSQVAPFITAATDPYAAHRTPDEIKNEIGSNVGRSYHPFAWQRNAEKLASSAVAKDVYNTRDAMELAEKLKKESGIDFNVEEVPNLVDSQGNPLSGAQRGDVIQIKPGDKYDNIDTIIHEFGHRKDQVTQPKEFQNVTKDEDNDMRIDPLGQMTAWKAGNLPGVESRASMGHFVQPGSYSLNNLVDKTKDLAAKQGLTTKVGEGYYGPDENPRYDYLKSITPTLKQLEGYEPNPQEPSAFEKLKQFLGK